MTQLREVHRTIEVPRGTGRDGFIRTVETILRLSRVQEVRLLATGEVFYRRFVRDDEPEEDLGLDLSTLMPYAIIRSLPIEELESRLGVSAAVVVFELFARSAGEGLAPIAFAVGTKTALWKWHAQTTGIAFRGDEAYGLPLLEDANIPDNVLVLCVGFSRDARLVDTKKAYKVTIPEPEKS